MNSPNVMFEPNDLPKLHNHALPDELPVGERMVWQGSPSWTSTAMHVFHVRKVAIYFGLLIVWRFAARAFDGASLLDAATYAVWLVPIACAGLALLTLLAFLTARTTIYTVTSKRVVMRIGIALSMTVNLPFKVVEGAGLKSFKDGSGDIALQLQSDNKAAYLVLWPHVRRWHLKRPQPSLRSIADARHVADILSEALVASQSLPSLGLDPVRPGQRLAYPTAAE
jgi:hypothetical protein